MSVKCEVMSGEVIDEAGAVIAEFDGLDAALAVYPDAEVFCR